MNQLAELFSRYLTGPRWEVTRDVLAQQPAALPGLVQSVEEDLRLLIDQLDSGDSSTNVRITTEHLVLLLGRMLPVIDSVVADIYMTQAVEIEDDDASDTVPAHVRSVLNELQALQEGLRKPAPLTMSRETIGAILETAVVVSSLHLQCLIVLRDLINARLNVTPR